MRRDISCSIFENPVLKSFVEMTRSAYYVKERFLNAFLKLSFSACDLPIASLRLLNGQAML